MRSRILELRLQTACGMGTSRAGTASSACMWATAAAISVAADEFRVGTTSHPGDLLSVVGVRNAPGDRPVVVDLPAESSQLRLGFRVMRPGRPSDAPCLGPDPLHGLHRHRPEDRRDDQADRGIRIGPGPKDDAAVAASRRLEPRIDFAVGPRTQASPGPVLSSISDHDHSGGGDRKAGAEAGHRLERRLADERLDPVAARRLAPPAWSPHTRVSLHRHGIAACVT